MQDVVQALEEGDLGPYAAAQGGQAHHQVADNQRHGEQEGGHHGHAHVIAGEAALAHAFDQAEAVLAEHLEEPSGPPQPLPPGLAEGGRLLVIEHCVGAEADGPALEDVVDGELDVLGEQVEHPAVGAFDDLAAEEEPGAGDGAAGAHEHPGVVEVTGLPDKPEGIAGGDPVFPVVFGVAVAGDHLVPVGEGTVHGLHEVAVQHVVRVKDEKSVKRLGVVLFDVFQQLFQGVPFAHLLLVEPGVHHGAVLAGDLCGIVGTVVGHHKGGDEALVVTLVLDALEQVRNHRRLVPGADEDGEAVEDLWFMSLLLPGKGDR